MADFSQTSQTAADQTEPDVSKHQRDGICPFFTTSQRSKILSNDDDDVIKLEDGTQIPIDEAVNIFESINFEDVNHGKHIYL